MNGKWTDESMCGSMDEGMERWKKERKRIHGLIDRKRKRLNDIKIMGVCMGS